MKLRSFSEFIGNLHIFYTFFYILDVPVKIFLKNEHNFESLEFSYFTVFELILRLDLVVYANNN